MPGLRRLLVVLVVLTALAGFGSARALAAAPDCSSAFPDPSISVPELLKTQHFNVVYDGDPTKTAYITETMAGNLAASAERAYAAYVALGFPVPVDDGFGKIDIQVLDLAQWNLASVICYGYFDFASASVGQPDEAYDVGADVFSEVEYNLFTPSKYTDYWLMQGAGAWGSWAAINYPAASTTDLGPFDMSLDCFDGFIGGQKCSKVAFEDLGESRWPFYEYLSERFGVMFIKEVLVDAQIADDSLLGLQNALIAHGTTLSATFNAFATKMMTGGWTAPSLNVATLPISGEPILTGIATRDIPSQLINVDHLATRYVEIDRGDGAADHPCFAATLSITVQIPPGVPSQPAFFWNGGSSSVDLAVSGNTATTTVPWDTCMWGNKGILSLPNGSTNINGKNFSVSAHLTVDTNTAATAKVPPAGATTYGQVINVTGAGAVPAISVFGPEILKVSADAQQIRLIVESSGEGSLIAALGAVALGGNTLRPGENDLRFNVPKGALASVRRMLANGTLLTLTPVSLDGSSSGPVVTQQLLITPVAPVQKQPKALTKKQAPKKQAPKAKKKKGH